MSVISNNSGCFASSNAVLMPPNPPPTTTMCCFCCLFIIPNCSNKYKRCATNPCCQSQFLLCLSYMDDFKQTLVKNGFKGELDDSPEAKDKYSHDASMFELIPKLVVMPKDSSDVQTLIKLVSAQKKDQPDLSVTARSAGTDMAGGAINESVIVDFNKHFTKVERVTAEEAQTQP